ncbi:MAG: hypothetical protein HY589_03145 [Candidatus Omnitrophica bacterium]|nr:hypothetical protein [Candidatus Omnitrophota bacterium]
MAVGERQGNTSGLTLKDAIAQEPLVIDGAVDPSSMRHVLIQMDAGKGTRFEHPGQTGPGTPKVIASLAGVPIAQHTIASVTAQPPQGQGFDTVISIVGHREEEVKGALSGVSVFITQSDSAAGTANAAAQPLKIEGFPGAAEVFFIIGGDSCIRPDVVEKMLQTHSSENNAVTLLTIEAPDKGGLGRIVRNPDGSVAYIVEERDAQKRLDEGGPDYALSDGSRLTPRQVLAISERNRSVYMVSAQYYEELLGGITNDNAQHQFYLTDIVEMARSQGLNVGAVEIGADDTDAALDINRPHDYAHAAYVLATNQTWINSSDRLKALNREFDDVVVNLTRPDAGEKEAEELRKFLASKGKDAVTYFVDLAAARWFGAEVSGEDGRENEIRLEKFLAAGGEAAIAHFVELIEADRQGESIGPWCIPAKNWDDPKTVEEILKRADTTLGGRYCASLAEADENGDPVVYYMPETPEGVKNWFEQERAKRMAQVAIQKALGRKVVVDVGVGIVGTLELLVACDSKGEMPERNYAAPLKFRPPLSGKDQCRVFALGYEPLGGNSYRQDTIDRGLVGTRADDPNMPRIANEGHQRGNLAASFLLEVVAVSDFCLLSIQQHPFKTLPGHAESIFADPSPGLRAVEDVARLMPPNALCLIESTVFPLYMEGFAIPVWEAALEKRGLPKDKWPSLGYSFQRVEPGTEGIESNRRQTRNAGSTTQRGRESLAEYFDLIGYKNPHISDRIMGVEATKDSENYLRYLFISTMGVLQDMCEPLGVDIYKIARDVINNRVDAEIAAGPQQRVIKDAIASLKRVHEVAERYARENILANDEREAFLGRMRALFSDPETGILDQAVLYPGGYCVIEQIGHLIYGMIATGLATELDIKTIFGPALATISFMKMRQRGLADWVIAELAQRGIDPRDAGVWAGGVTYMPGIEDSRNGSLEILVRHLADKGVTDFTVFDPYASNWDHVQQQDAFSPESDGYGLSMQTRLRGVNFVSGRDLEKRGRIATEDVYKYISPDTTLSPEQDVIILAMDHPQLVGRHQPRLRRTDGQGIAHEGLDAVKAAARMMGREGKVVLDTHNFLADEDIKEFFALGFEVRALGRGNIGGLRQEVEADTGYQIQVTRRLVQALEALRGQAGIDTRNLNRAIASAKAKFNWLQAKEPRKEELKVKYLAARQKQEAAYAKSIRPENEQAVMGRLVSSEVDPAVDKLQADITELGFLAEALQAQVVGRHCARPENPQDMLHHAERIAYLVHLLRNFIADSGLAANELFTSEGRKLLQQDPRFAGLFPEVKPVPGVKTMAPGQIEDEVTGVLSEVATDQFAGCNRTAQGSAELMGVHMGSSEQQGSIAQNITTDRPMTHRQLKVQDGAVSDPQRREKAGGFLELFRQQSGLSPLQARAHTFSYEANGDILDMGARHASRTILAELAALGIGINDANICLSGRVGDDATPQDRLAMSRMAESLSGMGCRNITQETAGPEQNTVVLTAAPGFYKDMDPVELAARAMAREGNLIFDANNALTNEQVKLFLALDWRVAGFGRNDIYGREFKDVKGNPRRQPGLIDEITYQDRLDAAQRLLSGLNQMQGQPEVDENRRKDAIATLQAKITYLRTRIEARQAEGQALHEQLQPKLDRAELIYKSMRTEQEKGYPLHFNRRSTKAALDHMIGGVVSPLERELSGLLQQAAGVSSALKEQLDAGRCRRPENPEDLRGQLGRLDYMQYVADDVLVDLGRASDVLLENSGQVGVRDKLDQLKAKARGDRLVLPQARPPQAYEAELRHAPMTPGIIQKAKEKMGVERLIARENKKKYNREPYRDFGKNPVTREEEIELAKDVSDKDAIVSLQERFWDRFAESGDLEVLPALFIEPGPDGRQEINVDTEGNLALRSERFIGDAAKGKEHGLDEWVKYSVLVPLRVMDAQPGTQGDSDREFTFYITLELLNSSIPWKTKQWIITEVLGKGRVLTTIKAEGSVPAEDLFVLMQGNPYADVGAPKDAGGSGRAGFLVFREGNRDEVVVTTDKFGREELIEIKGCGPAFGARTQDLVKSIIRRIAGGVSGGKVGMTSLSQLYGLVREADASQLIRLYDQWLRKTGGLPAGIAAFVAHSLPWESPDVIVGQVWRTVCTSKRPGMQLFADRRNRDFDPKRDARGIGFCAAELLAHSGDSTNVHIALGLDNIREGRPKIPRTTPEGGVRVPAGAQEAPDVYATDEDSDVNLKDERDPEAAFDNYFNWTLAFVLFGYEGPKSGDLSNPDYTYFPDFIDGFIKHFISAPIVRGNTAAIERLKVIQAACHRAKTPQEYSKVVEDLKKEARDSYMTYRVLRLRLEYGFKATEGDSVYTANTGKNFRRGRLTGKGPSRIAGEGKLKPSAEQEAREFLDTEEQLLKKAQAAMKEGGYPKLARRFDFGAAMAEIAEKRKLIDEIAAQERLVINQLFQVMGWGSFVRKTGYFSRERIEQERQRLADAEVQKRADETIQKVMEKSKQQAILALGPLNIPWRDFTANPFTDAERREIAKHIAVEQRVEILDGISDVAALDSLVEKAYRMLLKADENAPGLWLLEDLPSYVPVYELKYYPRPSKLVYAEVRTEDVARGGKVPLRVGSYTVKGERPFDKAAAQGRIAQAEEGRKVKAFTSEGEEIGLETFDAEGTVGVGAAAKNVPIKALVRRNPKSRKVVICHHGLAGLAAHRAAGWISERVGPKASIVTFTSSRLGERIPDEQLSHEVMDRMFGKIGAPEAKTFAQEVEDLRQVVRGTIEFFKAKGVPEDELEITLVGTSLGGQAASQVAADFPEVTTLMMLTASPETFSGSGLPPDQWHAVGKTPGKNAMGAGLSHFGGRVIAVKASEDLPARNRSIDSWEYYRPRPAIEYYTLRNDGHRPRRRASRDKIRQLAEDIVGDDWKLGVKRAAVKDAATQPTAAPTVSSYTVSGWQGILQQPQTSGIMGWLHQNYGALPSRIDNRVDRYNELLSAAAGSGIFGGGNTIINRTPCRVRANGGHTDFVGNGGCLLNMAGDLEMLNVSQVSGDRKVVLRNTNPAFAPVEFSLGDWDVNPNEEIKKPADWDTWCLNIAERKKKILREKLNKGKLEPISDEEFKKEWAKFREENWEEFVKGILAFLQTDLGDPTGEIRKKLKGFKTLLWSEIPPGWGLSTSSAVVMSTAMIVNNLFGLGLSEDDIINLGLSEHYNGTMGGMADHAAIIKGQLGKILLMQSYPEEIIRDPAGLPVTANLPDGACLFLADSGVKRSEAPQKSKKFQDEGINDPNIILARTGKSYAIAALWIRHHFPEYRQALAPDFAKTRDTYGLLREFNQGGKIEFSSEAERVRAMCSVLRSIPERVTRQQLLDTMPEFAIELDGIFKTHPEPAGGYNLRGYTLYGWAENERSYEYVRRANTGDFEGLLELMRIAQDGDRASKGGQPWTYEVTNAILDDWSAHPEQNPIWSKPGWFERSVEPVDELCDKIDGGFRRVAAGRVSGAGLGGAVTVLTKTDSIGAVQDFLRVENYSYTNPLQAGQGASVISFSPGKTAPVMGNFDTVSDPLRDLAHVGDEAIAMAI